MIAGFHVGHVLSHCGHHAGRFVAHHHRLRNRPMAVHEMKVGVAQPRMSSADEHLVGVGLVDGQVLNDQLAGAGVQNGAAHGVLLECWDLDGGKERFYQADHVADVFVVQGVVHGEHHAPFHDGIGVGQTAGGWR